MSNYFDNTNTQVTRGSFGSNYGKKITDKNLIPVTERKKENRQEALMEASKKHMEISKQAQKKQIDKIKNQREFRKVLNESYDKLKDDLFCNILHHICLEALCIDEQPMYENMENITNRINEQYKELGGFKVIKEQAKKTNNVLLERMISLCENTAKKVADRNMKESDSTDGFKFELTDDEKDDFEYNKDNINIDSISNKIKDKVIKVVSDEKEANAKKTEIMDEIEDKLKEDDVEDEATEEAMQFVFNENIETTTLFEALMRECYKITLETPKDLIFESYVKEECEDDIDDPEYNLNELDSYDDNNLMNDEVAEDLMISESFVKQLPVEKLKELEGYLSEAVRIKAKPGNLGFHFSYDTGVSDIIQSAKKREHIAKVVTQPGFRTSIMSLIKSAKHGPDIAYINQLAKLPHRLFGKKGRNVKILEDYTEWLNGEYKEAYLEALDNLGISLNTIPEFKQHLMPYEPMEDVFIEHAKSILEAVKDGDYEQLDKNLKDTSKDMKKVAEDCGKSKKNLSACKESIREVQKSTEELKDESKNNKLAKEACSPTTIAEDDKDLSEMLVCPICEKDPCECESDEVLNEEMLEDNLFEDAEFDDDDSEDEDIKKYLKEEDEDDDEEYDDDEEEDDDIVEEGVGSAIKNKIISVLKKSHNKTVAMNSKGMYEFAKKEISAKIETTTSVEEIDFLIKDLNKTITKAEEIRDTVLNDKTLVFNKKDRADVEDYVKWLKSEYPKLLKKRKKELESSVKKESFNIFVEDFEIDEDDDIVEEGLVTKIKTGWRNFIMKPYKDKAEQNKGKYHLYQQNIINAIKTENKIPTLKTMKIDLPATIKDIEKQKEMLMEDPKNKKYEKNIDVYLKWLKSDCSKLIDKRIKELSVKKESFNIFVEDTDDGDDFLEESSNFVCRSCGYVAEGKAPEYCPECGNDGDQFQVMEGYLKNLKAARKARKNISKDAYKFSIRNSGNILLNILQRNSNLASCRKRLEKMARKCKTLKEIEYLQKDLPNGKKYIQNKMNATDDPKKKEEYKKHLKWMSSDYSKIISNRKKELKNALKEQADFEQDFLYGKDRAVYENKDYSPSLNVPKPSKMRQYCLLKKINEATSFADIDKIKDYINEEVKEYKYNKEYTNWLKESAMNAVVLKHTVLEENIVIESFLDSLDDICDSIDKRLDSHDEAKQIALESMYTNFNGHNVFAPIFKANDVNSSNIEFAYKVKFLCEGLKGLTKDCENNIDLSQAERLIKRNVDTIDTVMESLDSSSYKYGILYNAKTYLEKISNKIPEIKDAYLIESVDVDYDEDILTEAIEMTDELYDNAISDDIMYNTKNSQMDVVMAEAITKYTIMETFNTLRLTDLNNTDIEKIVRSIVK